MDVSIRPIDVSDTDNILRWRNTEEVNRHFIYQKPLTRQGHLQWLETEVAAGNVAQFIIRDEVSKMDVGSVYLRDINKVHRKAEYGIFIGEAAARGRGVGSKAAELILEYAFTRLGLNKVFLRVFAENTNAIKSYANAGFVQEGLFRQDVIIDDTPRDMVFMSILKKEWLESNG